MSDSDNWRDRAPVKSHSFQMAFCDDPNCGMHIIAYDSNGVGICEVVTSADQTRAIVEACKDHLYDKATRK